MGRCVPCGKFTEGDWTLCPSCHNSPAFCGSGGCDCNPQSEQVDPTDCPGTTDGEHRPDEGTGYCRWCQQTIPLSKVDGSKAGANVQFVEAICHEVGDHDGKPSQDCPQCTVVD